MSPKDPLQSSEEGVSFIQPNGKAVGGDDKKDKNKSAQDGQNKGCCSKCCSWKCCGIATLIVFVILGATVLGLYLWYRSLTGNGPSMGDNEEWEMKLGDTSGAGVSSLNGE